MEQTRSEKYRATMVNKYGSEEKWRQAMREFGASADKTTPRGFEVMNKELHSEISKQGAKARWDKHSKEQKAAEKDISNDDFLTKV